MELDLEGIVGLSATASVIGLGLFVVMAQPRATTSRAFFLLALADGLSGILFFLRDLSTTVENKAYFYATYWYFFIAFVALLAGFGMLVPRPFRSRRARAFLAGALAFGALAFITWYVLDHAAFWRLDLTGERPRFVRTIGGTWVVVAFAGATAVILVRLTLALLRLEGTVRRQAAFIYGGVALGYGSSFAGAFLSPARSGYRTVLGDPALMLAYAGYLAATIALVATAIVIIVTRERLDSDVRHFLMVALAGTALFAALPFIAPGTVAIVQALALLAYPILLGYAILRFAVFDIDAKLRRAASLTIATGVISAIFVTTENLLSNYMQDEFRGVISSNLIASILAGLLAALLLLPIIRGSEKLAHRVVPALSMDKLHERKREIYRHSLAGALADGVLDDLENRTLAALREALGITPDEHDLLAADVKRSLGFATPS